MYCEKLSGQDYIARAQVESSDWFFAHQVFYHQNRFGKSNFQRFVAALELGNVGIAATAPPLHYLGLTVIILPGTAHVATSDQVGQASRELFRHHLRKGFSN